MANNYTAKDIKKHIAALNAVPGLPQMASIVGGKDKMLASFLDTVAEATDAGIGDSIPAPVRKFYAAIKAPEGKENATGGKQAAQDPKNGTATGGQYCREFQQTITIGGRREQGVGVACTPPDGTWRIVQ